MKFKSFLKVFMIITVLMGINGCKDKSKTKLGTVEKEKELSIYNFDNKEDLAKYNRLNLDETHPNMINPKISNTDYDLVIKSWTDLHQRIGNHLTKNTFNWEVKDSSISIVHKIYFTPNGEIENYFFNVLNEDVTNEKKEQFANLISDFAKDNRIEFKSEGSFAQCGKTKYQNE